MPLSLLLTFASGEASVVVAETLPARGPPVAKFDLSSSSVNVPGSRLSKRKKPSASVVCWAAPATGLPAASRMFTFTPATPGVAPSSIRPLLLSSNHTRLPTL